MIVYGSSLSPFVRKVLVFGEEKGAELEVRPIGLGSDDPEFRAASPFGKIPALADGSFSIADSSAIVHYLNDIFVDPPLIPGHPQEKARVIWFDEFSDTILFGCGRKMFFNRIVGPRFAGVPGDAVEADKAEAEELPPILDYLESVIPDGGWLVGDQLTLADIAVACPLVNLRHMKVSLGGERRPKLEAWAAKMLARPSFAKWIDKEERLLARTAPAA